MENSVEKYNQEWFKDRAINSLKKIKDGVWDFSDSLLLYLPSGVDEYEQMQKINTPYFRFVTKPEREYLQSISKNIVDMLPEHFDYIDLGPGTEHKEQFLFDELKKQGKTFTYIPVDISDHYLEIAEAHASKQGIEVLAIKSAFEELPALLDDRDQPRFVSLGLTFSNYDPQEALRLLHAIAQKDGKIFINVQIRDRVDMTALQKIYQDDARHQVDEKVQLIGLNPDLDITPRIADSGFRVWCTITKNNKLLSSMGVAEGDRLLVFQSLRYTKDELKNVLCHFSNVTLLDTGSSFIGSIIST